ncbi:DUF4886 domain-containing protein [Mangrovimonas futianensis]|uniref:DUF4886 domain-containing protein n=1 Tax=Mangrovimonas futianensis TaxID=2895523 RepID=UPI001E597975|nr:DUF4886 domain-containing protein [Mangrovimonas futianensis]MCF1420405.1 DUF4886 domain-containing protein [Mangrovimonas futianensis]
MRNIFLIIMVCCAWGVRSQDKTMDNDIHVLFIGNSLTYFYDMPQTLQMMLNETHPNIKIHQSTFPGQDLSGHMNDIITTQTENEIHTRKKVEGEQTETELKLAERRWDVIILQTGTVAVLIPENLEFKVNKAISEIKHKVGNPDAKFILFSTWPSKEGYPKQYCYPSRHVDLSIEKRTCCSPKFESMDHEMENIIASYTLVAKENDLIKSNNGEKYFEVLTQFPELELYDDDIHPNKKGAFLNACIFYQLLTNKKATDLKYIGSIEPEMAKLLKQIAG